jgi:hypothetical protein
VGSFDREELLDLWKISTRRRLRILPTELCRTPIDAYSTSWGNLREDAWFGTLLAKYPETSWPRRECADADVWQPMEDFL